LWFLQHAPLTLLSADLATTINTSTSRAHIPTTRATAVAAGLQRPTIEREWWSVTTVRWNELLVEAASDNRTKATTAITTLRKYHDANVIMSSDAGKDAPAGHCKQCWDKKKNVPKRRCRVFAIHIDGQSLACAFCRLKGAGGCDANPKEEEEEVSLSTRASVYFSAAIDRIGIGTQCCHHYAPHSHVGA
jgi:hypothetical protein